MSNFNPYDAYTSGLRGCEKNPRADEEFVDSVLRHGGDPDGGHVAHEWEFADKGSGKLSLLTPVTERIFPGSLPGPAQLTGDCVARAAANCLLASIAMEIDDGRPDEITGLVEGPPDIPELGVRNGVIASESLWAWRGYDGDGWVCSRAAQVATTQGFLARRDYPEIGVDLTRYTKETLRIGGSRKPASKWLDESKQRIARTATVVTGREQVRDFLFAGFGIMNCSGMGFERTRDQFGASRQVGRWMHAQSYWGYDDRPETHRIYGEALVLWGNTWGKWNAGPRLVRGTNIEIPHGFFWAKASTIDRASNIALSSVAGWPRRKHTTYGAAGNV